jgi:deoxycytidylate deaminase
MKQRFFNIAKKLATRSNHTHKLGCVIAKKNRLISLGNNSTKTHPRAKNPYSMIHAEFAAILNVPLDDLKGSEAYVYRELKNGAIANSRPCRTCYKALQDVGVKIIYYTDNGGYKKEYL